MRKDAGWTRRMRETKGAIENEVVKAVVRFGREQHGKGPADVRALVVGDLLVVRSVGIFTPTEAGLSATEDGRRLIASSRRELRGINGAEIEAIIARIVGCAVRHSFFDVNVAAGEQSEIYVLAENIEKRL